MLRSRRGWSRGPRRRLLPGVSARPRRTLSPLATGLAGHAVPSGINIRAAVFLIAYLFFLRLDFYLGIILVFLKRISWASPQMVMFFSSLLICQIIKWIKFLNISLFLE